MKSIHRHLIAAGLVASLGLSAAVQAQPTTAPAGPGGQHMTQGQRGQHDPARAERWRARMQERMAQRLAVLKAQLKITTAQEGAWTTWTNALQPQANRPQRPDRTEMARLSTPERIDRMKALRAARNADMDRRLDATKSFYTALSAEQKAAFDAVGLRFMGGKGKGQRGGRGEDGMRHHYPRG